MSLKKLIDKKTDPCGQCTLFDGYGMFPDVECVNCGKKWKIKVSGLPAKTRSTSTPEPKALLYLHDIGLTVEETETEVRIKHKDIPFMSVISKSGSSATLGQPTPTWKYIEYLKNNSRVTL